MIKLSRRERQILDRLALGMENTEIATDLGIAYDTVKLPLKRLFVKTGARNRAHAVSIGYLAGLLPGTKETA